MPEYVDKQTYEITNKMITTDLEKLTKTVEKVVDKMDQIATRVEKHDKDIKYQNETQNRLEKSINKLIDTFERFNSEFHRVDVETAVNSERFALKLNLDWKFIMAALAGLSFIVAAWKA